MLWSTSTTLTPQQQLAAMVAADQAAMQAGVEVILQTLEGIAKNIYCNPIGNGTPGQTFAPQDYFDVLATAAGKLPLINAATQTFITALATIVPPPSPLNVPQIPPAGVTLTTNEDDTLTVAGPTPLQVAQAAAITTAAALVSAQTALDTAKATLATAQTAAATANAAFVAAGASPTQDQIDALHSTTAAVTTDQAAVATAQTNLNTASAADRTAQAAVAAIFAA